MKNPKKERIMASALTSKILRSYKIGFDNSCRNTRPFWPLIILLATLFVGGYWPSTAQAAYIIHQQQEFFLQLYPSIPLTQVSQEDFDINNPEWNKKWDTHTVDLNFNGAQSSIILNGNNWDLTRMTYNLFGIATYTVGVYSVDHAWYDDCWSSGFFAMNHTISPYAFTLPNQETTLSSNYDSLYADDINPISGDWFLLPFPEDFTGTQSSQIKSKTDYMTQAHDFYKNNTDLSFLYVDDFTIQLWQILYLQLDGWGSGDEYSGIYIRDYGWGGIINIDYYYEQAPDNPPPKNAVPEPATMLLLGLGLIGLAGIRRKD